MNHVAERGRDKDDGIGRRLVFVRIEIENVSNYAYVGSNITYNIKYIKEVKTGQLML